MTAGRGAALAVAVAVAGLALLLHGPPAEGQEATPTAPPGDDEVADGRLLYLTTCASCHGDEGQGTDRAPSLEDAGAASAYYYVVTGRMPMADDDDQPQRKEPAFSSEEEIRAVVAYVATLGDGPPIPAIDLEAGDLAEGGVLYRSNCAPCHSAAGIGGVLSYGRAAPSVHPSEPYVIASAIRIGPGEMPVFDEAVLDDEEVASVVRYVRYLDEVETPGGAALGGAGPIPEGFVAWIFGIGGAVLATVWIGRTVSGR